MSEPDTSTRDQPASEFAPNERAASGDVEKSPARPLWLARMCFLIALIALPFSLRHYSLTTHLAVATTVIASFLAACLSIIAIRRRTYVSASDRPVPSRGMLWRTLGLALLFLAASMVGTVFHFGQIRDISKASVTMASLRAIGQSLEIYQRDSGDVADSLGRLVSGVDLLPKRLVSYGDKQRPRAGQGDRFYSSFVYNTCPARLSGNSRVVAAYELECWTLIKTGLLAEYGRCVLFADGHVEVLSEDAFADAMALDAEVRKNASQADAEP